MATAIVWFRSDLRIADNPALHHALARGERVVPVYIHAPEELSPWQPGAASRWWLHHSLTALSDTLARLGSRLIVRHGPSGEVLGELVRESGASEVHLNRNYEPAAARRDEDVEQQLHADGMQTHAHHAALLFEPGSVRNKMGEPYRVFTPFWRLPEHGLDAAAARQPSCDAARARAPLVARDCTTGFAAQQTVVRRIAGDVAARRDGRASAPAGLLSVGARALSAMARPSRPPRHLAALALSALWRDQRAASRVDLARLCAARRRCRHHRGGRGAASPAHLARVRAPPASPLSAYRRGTVQSALRRVSVAARRCAAARMAARAHRHPDHRCGHAPAVADGLDAQSRAHDRRVVSRKKLPPSLVGWRTLVLGDLDRRRPRQQQLQLAMGRGLRRRRRALSPHLQSAAAG